MSKLIIEKYFLATWTHYPGYAPHGLSISIQMDRNPCAKKYCYREIQSPSFFSCCGYWVSAHSQEYYVMPTTSQDTCPIESCYTIEYCFYTESGPFIFKHLWGTTMWLKPIFFQTYTCKDRKPDCLTILSNVTNILAVVVGRTFGTADGSFCAWL